MPEPVLSIRDLVVEFGTEDGVVHAVDGISYDVFPGETLGIVGESGSGKSVSTLSILGLIPQPPGRITSGTAVFKGRDLLKLKKKELRQFRGDERRNPMRRSRSASSSSYGSSASRTRTFATRSIRMSSPGGCASAR